MGGYNDEDMFGALERYAATTNSVIGVERDASGSFCAALVTPFMKRVHALREVDEVVFVDATASVDRLNTATFVFVPPSWFMMSPVRKTNIILSWG